MMELLKSRLVEAGIPAPEEAAEKLGIYHALLLEYNQRMDLTAVLEDGEIIDRHYIDSLLPLSMPGMIPDAGNVIDVGTGAGFPGMMLALFRPDLSFTLLDAQQKRLTFLEAVLKETGTKNVTLVHARAEDGARTPALREQFDLAVARAVAAMPVLAEYLLPYVKVGGKALCWKGPGALEELPQAAKAARILGGRLGEAIPAPIPGRDWQHILLPVFKETPTPKKYPRKAGTPGKEPLGV